MRKRSGNTFMFCMKIKLVNRRPGGRQRALSPPKHPRSNTNTPSLTPLTPLSLATPTLTNPQKWPRPKEKESHPQTSTPAKKLQTHPQSHPPAGPFTYPRPPPPVFHPLVELPKCVPARERRKGPLLAGVKKRRHDPPAMPPNERAGPSSALCDGTWEPRVRKYS